MSQTFLRSTRLMAVLAAVLLCSGCPEKGAKDTASDATGAAAAAAGADTAAAPAEQDAKAETMLARADAVDGTVDHVVSKCAMCAFYMDGRPEFSVDVHGYKVQLCSEHCKESFEKDTKAAILAMQIPKDAADVPAGTE